LIIMGERSKKNPFWSFKTQGKYVEKID
jgi:hypothetical protein